MIAAMLTLLADAPKYVPFRDPMAVDKYWLLLMLPLVVAIAIVYKTIKLDDLEQLPKETASLASQIIVFMLLAATFLWLTTELI